MSTPRFWREQSRRYNIIGNKCLNCDKIYFPKRIVCPECQRESIGKMSDLQLSGKGEILTYSIVHQGTKAFDLQTPYIIAIIQTEEGVKLTAQIVDCDLDKIKVGMKVESCFRKIAEDGKSGIIYYGFKFKPME